MGLCCDNRNSYLCKLRSPRDIKDFQQLCDIYEIDIKEIDDENIIIKANEIQIRRIRNFCRNIYTLYDYTGFSLFRLF